MTEDSRPHPPFRGDEKSTLWGFLQFLRATMVAKCTGLTEEQLRCTPTVSTLSLLGLVRHLAFVERQWFQAIMEDRIVHIPWHHGEDEFQIPELDSAESIIAFYQSECAISDEIIDRRSCDDLAQWANDDMNRRSLRWIVTHMIEETARHCGHADLIRESIDGAVGE